MMTPYLPNEHAQPLLDSLTKLARRRGVTREEQRALLALREAIQEQTQSGTYQLWQARQAEPPK